MSKKECDIIKDLLPSYVDEICSEASKEWIEGHLAECEECRASAEVMRHTEISAKKLEQEQLEAGRKVIRKNLHRSMLNLGLCLLMAVLMIFVFELDSTVIPHLAIYIALPIGMLMTWLVCRNQTKRRGWDKWDTLLTAGVLLTAGYGVVIMHYGFSKAIKSETIFGVAKNELGPFLYAQMVLAAVVCFAVYLVQMVRTAKKGRSNSILLQLCLTGIFLMMAYCIYMGQLSDFESALKQLEKATLTVLAVGLTGIAFFALMDKLEKQ